MKRELDRLSYDFSLQGSEGGLTSLRAEFTLQPAEDEGVEEIKAGMRTLMDQHTEVFDSLFDAVFSGRREPVLMDSESYSSTGYRYSGRLKKRSEARLRSRLRDMFGSEAVKDSDDLPFDDYLTAEVSCSALKGEGGFRDVTVNVRLRLGGAVNVCYFNFLKALPGLGFSSRANREIASLERVLSADRNVDHYQAMLGAP